MSLIIVYHLLLLCIPRQKKEHLSCLKFWLGFLSIKFNVFLTCLAMPNDFPDFELNVCFDWD